MRSIPFYEWNCLEGLEQQKAYLGQLLASVPVQLASRPGAGPAPHSN